MSADLNAAIARLESVAARLEKLAGHSASGAAAASTASEGSASASVEDYQAIIAGSVAKFVELSNKIGGDVATHAALVKDSFDSQLALIQVASQSKKPAADAFQKLIAPFSDILGKAGNYAEVNRRSKFPNHLSAVSSGIPALGWIAMEPKPAPFVKEMGESATFYTNRILKEFKDSDATQVDWAKTYTSILSELHDYVKKHHTTGLVWNPKGGDAAAAKPAAASAAAPSVSSAAASAAADAAALAAAAKVNLSLELSKGTSGLKHVDKSQMTHKNPDLRASSVVPAAAASAPVVTKTTAAAAAVVKPPVLELQGKKWAVEYHKGNKTIVLDKVDMKQSVYIYKCDDSVIQIKGKVNSIAIDACTKTAVVFEDCLGSIELINCKSIQIQVINKVATVSIDKTDGAQVYLSKTSIDAHIITAKSSEMNVLIPKDDGEYTEIPVPEQFKSVYKGGKLITEVNDVAG